MSLERELIENRPRLWGLAYRMLGSASDAEDVLQEAYLRIRNVEASTVREPGAYLMTVVTRLAVDELRSARRRRQDYLGPWLPEPIATDATGEEQVLLKESINFGLMLALENLNPIERAAFCSARFSGMGLPRWLASSRSRRRTAARSSHVLVTVYRGPLGPAHMI